MSRKLDLAEKLQREFEDLVTEKEQRKYGKFVRENTAALIDKRPKNKREALKLIGKNKIDTKTSTKMFTALNGVMTTMLNPDTRESRKKLKPLEGLMRVYSVRNPKSFAKEVYSMTTGSGMSERNKKFRPLLLSYYDGFTENIEDEAKQAERAMQRAEVEKVSTVFKDLEDLREQRIPITQVKKQLIAKYGDPKRVKRALNTELHEQAERVKLEQSKFMGYTHKVWNTQKDERVRQTRFHNQVAGKVVPIDSNFRAAGMEADYPSDLGLPISERINCRCFVTYQSKPSRQAAPTSAPIIAPPRPRTRRQAATAAPTPQRRQPRFKQGSTREEALTNLRDLNPKVSITDAFSSTADPEFARSTANRIGTMMDRFGLDKDTLLLDRDIKQKNVGGNCRVPFYGGDVGLGWKRVDTQRISFNVGQTKKDKSGAVRQSVIDETKQAIQADWHVPVDEENLYDYTAIHEFGHHVHMTGIGNNEKHIEKIINMRKDIKQSVFQTPDTLLDVKDAFDKVKESRKMLDGEINSKASFGVMNTTRQQLYNRSNRLYEKISYVLREKTVMKVMENEGLDESAARINYIEQVSRYGKSNTFEWFAETFTEYTGSKEPRAHAKAFGQVLEEVFDGTT